MIISMAFRNVFRHKKRTVLTMLTVIFGIFAGIMGDGLNSGMKWQVSDIYTKTMTSSYNIYGSGFFNEEEKNDPIEYLFDEKSGEELLKTQKGIIAHSNRILIDGSVTNGIEEMKTRFIGVYPDEENRVFDRKNSIISGVFTNKNSKEKIVIGSELAKILNLKKGDTVTIMARTANKAVNAYDVEIEGLIRTGNPIVDNSYIFMNIDFAKSFADTDKINDIAVKRENTSINKIEKEMAELNKKSKDKNLIAVSWYKETEDLMDLIKFRGKIFSVITFVILLMAAAGITNTMLMAMLERKKEIGIMMANGMASGKIAALFTVEGAFIGVLGSSIAFITGFLVVSYFAKVGISIPMASGGFGSDFPIKDKLYLYFDIVHALIFYVIGILVATLSALYPAIKAVKLEPVEAIKGN